MSRYLIVMMARRNNVEVWNGVSFEFEYGQCKKGDPGYVGWVVGAPVPASSLSSSSLSL